MTETLKDAFCRDAFFRSKKRLRRYPPKTENSNDYCKFQFRSDQISCDILTDRERKCLLDLFLNTIVGEIALTRNCELNGKCGYQQRISQGFSTSNIYNHI